MPHLGVNVDHIATLRQARRETEPDILAAARICEEAGADSIVCHLREDRRHIQDSDVRRLRQGVTTKLNLEMALNKEIVAIAAKIRPDQCTLVPERRQELTTEGGLDVIKFFRRIKDAAALLQDKKIVVSLFIAPDPRQIEATKKAGINMIELHTGCYAHAHTQTEVARELRRISAMTQYARSLGIIVNAGHGLNYSNTKPVAKIDGIAELNIGFAIIARSVFVGLAHAVEEMKRLSAG